MATVGISDSQSQEVNIEDTQETTKSASVSASTHKRRKNRSEVWDHFEKLEEGTYKLPEDDDYKRGKCKACNSVLICDSRYGTTNLKRHIKACVKLQGQSDLRQMLLNASEEDQGDVDALTEEMTYLDLNASTSEGGSNEPLQVLGVGAFKTMVTRLETWSMLAQLDNSCRTEAE
ncbi:hypothetical protein Cgig2_031241 [Carnegiea gigantea]|uniref:BED-type domain-containing protein n=1 Tax=Carnegiea gigantea TaxID=171969 RepID=A0A9Q1KMD6_9CARY|nr:hypothetical protein Cgig2_031241 [Carnegiea gigantea]